MVFKQVNIQRFKNLNDVLLDLDGINLIVGSNNSEKAVYYMQFNFCSINRSNHKNGRNARWLKDSSTSIASNQLIYSPLKDVYALAPFGDLKENRGIIITISEENTGSKNNYLRD